MGTTYLKDFQNFQKNKTAYVPVGTLEWHGNHLPIETDFLIAQKICELLSKKNPGYILPPIFLGTDRHKYINGKRMAGMDRRIGRFLGGSLYYVRPNVLNAMISGLVENLINQKFSKIIIVSGHGGTRQIEVLEKIARKYKTVTFINPWKSLNAHHADEIETSLFWACYPDEEKKSRNMEFGKNTDITKYYGYDPKSKASLASGKKLLAKVISKLNK